MKGQPPPRASTRVHDASRPFWLFSLFRTAFVAVVAYFVAAFSYLVVERITQLPHGGVWDEGGFRATLLFVLLAVLLGFMLVPYFQKEWDAGTRTLSLFSATFLGAYAVFHATGTVDPEIPLNFFVYYVFDPMRRTLGF